MLTAVNRTWAQLPTCLFWWEIWIDDSLGLLDDWSNGTNSNYEWSSHYIKNTSYHIDLPVSFELVGSLCNCDLRQRLEQSQLWKMLRSCWFGSHYLPHCHWPMRAWSQVRNYSPIACHKVTEMHNSNGAFSTIVPAVRCTLTSILKPFASSWEMPE
jgi:hypothetical protein